MFLFLTIFKGLKLHKNTLFCPFVIMLPDPFKKYSSSLYGTQRPVPGSFIEKNIKDLYTMPNVPAGDLGQ